MNTGKRVLIYLLVCILAMGCGFAGGMLGAKMGSQATPPDTGGMQLPGGSSAEETGGNVSIQTGANGQTQISINVGEDVTIAEAIAAKVMPSVVGITTTYSVSYSSGSYGYFGFGGGRNYSYDSSCVGTGFVVDESGYILTNSHVVNDGDYKGIVVSLYDGSEVEGTVLWNDSVLDLAVVKVESGQLVAAELGDSDEIKYGSYAAVIGNPLGLDFERSISQGIISGLHRTISVSSDGSSSSATTMEDLIQTDATINSGNSGGPLLNSKGQVVGINSAKAASGEGMGFAIPINVAKPIVSQLKESGKFERAYLGISGIGLSEASGYTEEQLKSEFGTTTGIYVASVNEGSGAEMAGLKKGDIILSVEGVSVGTMNKINTILIGYRVGDSVQLVCLRNGEEYTVSVELSSGSLSSGKVIQD